MAAGDSQVKVFSIEAFNGQPYTTELYPNERHQCRVNLLVLKEVENAEGHWIQAPLTQAEIDSATVTGFGPPTQSLPKGWYCDKTKNEYDAGLRPIAGEVKKKRKASAHDAGAHPSRLKGVLVELIPRYMRVGSNIPIDTQRFMGRITVGGKIYTTNGNYGVGNFLSFVDIKPTPGYTLRTSDLAGYSDLNAFSGTVGNNKVDIDVYYFWPLLVGLRFIDNLGLFWPAKISGEGANFQSVLAHHIGKGVRNKIGVVGPTNVLDFSLRVNDVHSTNVDNHPVVFNRRPTIMRAVRYKGWMDTPDVEVRAQWRLLDNYGFLFSCYLNWSGDRNLVGVED